MIFHEQPVLYSVDLSGCTAIATLDSAAATTTFTTALESAGATVVQVMVHRFPGGGLTCVLILAESHAVLHTWPETGTVNIDIFSCSTGLDSAAAIEQLGRTFGAAGVTVQEIHRADGYGSRPGERR